MKKVVFRSFLVVLLLMGIFHSKASAAQTTAASVPNEMSVFAATLPVYRSFEELSDFRIHLDPNYQRYAELAFNDKVTILSQKDYAAEIQMADGRTGWVQKDYLTKDIKIQTWLVKEGRNLREGPSTSTAKVGFIPDRAKVIVLDYNKDTNFYKVQTADGLLTGWIYGYYQGEKDGVFIDYRAGSNVIPYNFDQAGKVNNKISLFTPLNTTAQVTENQINQFISYKTKGANTLMTGMGAAYMEAQRVTGVNAIYLLAHSGLESKWGTSDIAKAKNNFYGIGAEDLQPAEGAYNYDTPSNGIIAGAIFINRTYINRSPNFEYPFPQPTLDNMRFNSNLHQYSTDEAWAGKIVQIAQEFYNYAPLKTGWVQDNGNWYYYNQSGVMQTGWVQVNTKWYYLNSSGVMLTGWQYINGKWYYLNSAGDMKTGWLYSGSKWYFLDQSGAMKTGWVSNGGKWYYMNNSGVMQTGWVKVSGKWYYLYTDGHMAANTTIGGYRLGKDGAMI